MNIQELENRAYGRLAHDEIEECLGELKEILRLDEHELKSSLIELQAQWSEWKKADMRGIEKVEKSTLRDRISSFMAELFARRRAEMFHEKIWAVAYDETAADKLRRYLNPEFFDMGNISLNPDLKEQAAQAKDYDFVLFDTYHAPDDDKSYSRELLTQYLNAFEVKVVLLFGPHDEAMNATFKSYRNKFFAANSPFSLYARIRELREFLKIHGAPEVSRFD